MSAEGDGGTGLDSGTGVDGGAGVDGGTRVGRMAVVEGIAGLDRGLGRLFVVVGVFDGLHLGHEYLLRELRREAEARAARPAVITFDHHPDEVLTGAAPPLLCDPIERLERLADAGVAVTVVQTFDVALRETPFDAFVRDVTARAELAGFLMTPESAFGYQRAGTPERVAALGRDLGYDVAVVPSFTLGGRPVSSTAIRAAIDRGDLADAARLLGRPVTVTGRARREGQTTVLDLALPLALPPEGEYPGEATVDGAADGSGPPVARRPRAVTLHVEGAARIAPELGVPDGTRVAVRLPAGSR